MIPEKTEPFSIRKHDLHLDVAASGRHGLGMLVARPAPNAPDLAPPRIMATLVAVTLTSAASEAGNP
jgi:hypothetical protein